MTWYNYSKVHLHGKSCINDDDVDEGMRIDASFQCDIKFIKKRHLGNGTTKYSFSSHNRLNTHT